MRFRRLGEGLVAPARGLSLCPGRSPSAFPGSQSAATPCPPKAPSKRGLAAPPTPGTSPGACHEGRGAEGAAQPPVTLLQGCWGAAPLQGGFGGLEGRKGLGVGNPPRSFHLPGFSCFINVLFCIPVEGCVFSLL